MLTRRCIIKCTQPQDWFAAIDLKDAYFHVSILLRHRPFLQFARFEVQHSPSGSPCAFTTVVEGALALQREVGVRVPNYLDNWPILAQSREQLCDHKDLVLRHLSQLGLRVNWEKSKLSPVQRISFLGVELDSVSMTACLTDERAQAVLKFLQRQECGTAETVSEAPGAYGIRSCSHAARVASYETTSALATLPSPEVGMASRYTSSKHHSAVSPLPQPLDGPCLSTGRGAPRTSVPACCCHNRCLKHGLGRYMQQAGSLGALDGAPTALAHQLPRVVGSASNLTAVPARQARASLHRQQCGCLVHQPVGRYTITPHVTARPPSPPLESHAVQVTARCPHPGEAQSCGRRALTTSHVPRRMVSRTPFPCDSPSLAHSSEEGSPLSGARHHMAPASRSVEPPCVAPGQDAADLSGLPLAVVETITQARAPSTRQIYALKWSLFANWCSRREDPRICTIGEVLSFLQDRLERRLSPSTLKVYVAAIAAHQDAVDGQSLGKHDLIVRFLKGARRMNPSRSPLVPSWDLSIILAGLQRNPFEPLDSVELKFLLAKTVLLTTLTSIKMVGDLQAFSVSEECLVFGPVYSHVVTEVSKKGRLSPNRGWPTG